MARTKLTIVVCLAIAVSSFMFYPLLLSKFPDNGTFNREIWFIKPTKEEAPYFILIDDIFTGNDKNIEWIQHGKDNLTLDSGTQEWNFSTVDYFQGEHVKLYGKIITEDIEFEQKTGFASVTEDNKAPYLIAETKGSQQICTILIPLNESMALPEINMLENLKNQTSFSIQHNTTQDIFWSRFHDQETEISQKVDNWIPTARTFFLRTNESNALLSLAFKDATRLNQADKNYFSSSKPISGSLSFTELGLDGTIEVKEPCQVEFRIPEPRNVLINGQLADSSEYNYEEEKLILTFAESGNYTLGNQYPNYGEMDIEEYSIPSGEEAVKALENKQHPFLIFEDSDIPNILNNIQSRSPTNEFYLDLKEETSQFEKLIFLDGEVSFEGLERDPFKNALICWSLQVLKGEEEAIQKIKQVLEKIPRYLNYSGKTLDTAQIAYGAAIAYDTIYNNLTASEQDSYAEKLKTFINPIKDAHDVIPLNNHLATDIGALGLVGLVTKDPDLLQLAINEMGNFLDAETVDGIPIESFSIASIGHHLAAPYFYAMSHLGIIDYYKQGAVIDRYYDRAMDMMSPMGLFPHYEDSFDDWRPLIEFRQVAHLTKNEDLRQKIAHFYHLQNESSIYNLNNKYFFLELFQYRNQYRNLSSPRDLPHNRTSWLSYKGGNGAFRTSWEKDAVFISFNAKTYHQSHTQLDELSYEIYAYGALLSMNSGFPGWKKEGHSECVSTIGSNSIRLNGQDQLRETCGGFSFHAFSKEVNIVSMVGGDLYRSPYAFSQNPIFYLILIALQISFISMAFYYFVVLRKEKKGQYVKDKDPNQEKEPLFESQEELKNFESLLDLKKSNFKPLNDDRLIYRWKVFQAALLLYFGLYFRIYAFAHSILRKLTEWSYTRDYELINSITNLVWAVLFVGPLILTLLIYLIFRRVHFNLIRSVNQPNSDLYAHLKKRMNPLVIFIAIFIFFVDFAAYLREYRIMDLISKRFGTVSGFAQEFVSWALFQIGILSFSFGILLAFFIYKYYKLSPQQTKKYCFRFLFLSLVLILLWTAFAILIHGVINSFTIETWVA